MPIAEGVVEKYMAEEDQRWLVAEAARRNCRSDQVIERLMAEHHPGKFVFEIALPSRHESPTQYFVRIYATLVKEARLVERAGKN